MAIWSKIFRRKAKRENTSSNSSAPRTGATSIFVAGNSYQALQISTVYRCVQILGGSVASLPLRQLKLSHDGTFREDVSSRLAYLLRVQPNARYNAFDFWNQVVQQMCFDGEAVIVPMWSRTSLGEVDSFELCAPGTVSYDETADIYHISDFSNGISGDFRDDEIIHIKGMSIDGKYCISVLSFARLTLSIAGTGDEETLERFANGGGVKGIIGNDNSVRGFGEYQDDELSQTAEDLDSDFRAGKRIVSLPGQAQFHQLSMSSVDMEFLASRKFSVREICRFFGVPPTFVFDDTSNNYKSAEMANVAFLSQTLNPILTKIEQELLRKLVPASRAHRFRFDFDRRGLYTTDLAGKADYQTKTIASGVYTINDWRKYENMPEVDGGDRVLVSANLKPLNELLNENQHSDE